MEKQTIISIGREFGSGGHEIAEKIAKDMGIQLYDRGILDAIATDLNVHVNVLEPFDEKPRNFILTRRVNGYSNSMEEILADMQFEFIKRKAEEGESFVIVGRCAEAVLKDFDNMISIFVNGDRQCKVERVKEKYHLSEAEAFTKMTRHDKKRKQYHNRHTDTKWGDSRYYDLCINSSSLGIDKTVKVLENYINARMDK